MTYRMDRSIDVGEANLLACRVQHRLNMELNLQIHLGSCVQLYSLAETSELPHLSRMWAHIRGRYCSVKTDDISL
jgi:hypothetical protein